ncbi:MAG: hypothetical protein FWC47_06435 [Oscillospiraceae bacterium]|nr:hypothetical protein [Oscillospiraceae bacterium]
MANITNGSFRRIEPTYIISNEIDFFEKTESTRCRDSNIIIVFLSPIIAILIGKFISLLNILGFNFILLFRNRENLNQIITSVYNNILSPAMDAPNRILEQYTTYWNEFIKIISGYVDIYFYTNLFYFLTLIVAFMFVLVLMRDRNLHRISALNFIKTNYLTVLMIFALGFISSLIISSIVHTIGNRNITEQTSAIYTFRLFLMSLTNVIIFAYIHEYLFRGIIPVFFWQKLNFIEDKLKRYVFLNIILLLSSILFVVTMWGLNFLLILNFILMAIFFRIVTCISDNIYLNVFYLIAFNLVGTLVYGYPILNFKDQYNLIHNTLSDYTIYSGGNLGLLGTLFSTILLVLLICLSVVFYDSLKQIIKKS